MFLIRLACPRRGVLTAVSRWGFGCVRKRTGTVGNVIDGPPCDVPILFFHPLAPDCFHFDVCLFCFLY